MKKGFTLIELLVVIAIIAILAAILFPVFAKAREKARQATCISNQKQIALAIMMSCQDNDERLPLAASWAGDIGISTPKIFDCKSTGHIGSISTSDSDYVYFGATDFAGTAKWLLSGKALAEFPVPSETFMTADVANPGKTNSAFVKAPSGATMLDLALIKNAIGYPHSAGTVVAFLDGHVEYLKKENVTMFSVLNCATADDPIYCNPTYLGPVSATAWTEAGNHSTSATYTTMSNLNMKVLLRYSGTLATPIQFDGGTGSANKPLWMDSTTIVEDANGGLTTGIGYKDPWNNIFGQIRWNDQVRQPIAAGRNLASSAQDYTFTINPAGDPGKAWGVRKLAVIYSADIDGWAGMRYCSATFSVAGYTDVATGDPITIPNGAGGNSYVNAISAVVPVIQGQPITVKVHFMVGEWGYGGGGIFLAFQD